MRLADSSYTSKSNLMTFFNSHISTPSSSQSPHSSTYLTGYPLLSLECGHIRQHFKEARSNYKRTEFERIEFNVRRGKRLIEQLEQELLMRKQREILHQSQNKPKD
jgi:hypothetical protein